MVPGRPVALAVLQLGVELLARCCASLSLFFSQSLKNPQCTPKNERLRLAQRAEKRAVPGTEPRACASGCVCLSAAGVLRGTAS